MIFLIEKYKDILSDIKDIVPKFMKEVDIYPERPEPNFDHDQFIALDNEGQLQVATIREKSELIGIHVACLMPDIFYKHILTAYVMWYYVKPEARGKGVGAEFFGFTDRHLEEKGAERIFMSRKIYIPNEKLFDRLGYTHFEAAYTKHLG